MSFHKTYSLKKISLFLLFLLFFQLSFSKPYLKIGIYEESIIMNKRYLVEEVLKWGEINNYKIKIIIANWPTLEKKFKEGQIDGIYPINITQKRKSNMVFTKVINSDPVSIYSKIPNTIKSLEEIQNKRVGTYNSQLFKENLYDKIKKIKYMDTQKELFENYHNGTFEYIITNHESTKNHIKDFNIVGNLWFEDEGRIGLQKKYSNLIPSLNSHFFEKNGELKAEILKKIDDQKYNQLFYRIKKRVKYRDSITLDIVLHKTAKPFVKIKDGQLVGDSVEVINLFNKLSPYIHLNILPADSQDTFNNEVKKLKEGKIDAMFPMGVTKQRDKELKKIDLIYHDYIVILGHKSSPKISSLFESKGLVGFSGSKVLKDILLQNIPKDQIREFDTRKITLDSLNKREIDYIIDVQATSENYLSKKSYKNIIKILELSPIEYGFYLTPKTEEKIYDDISLIMEFINNEEGPRVILEDNIPAYFSKYLNFLKFILLFIIIVIGIFRWQYKKEKSRSEKIFKALIESLENVNHINHMETGLHIERVGGYSEVLSKGLKLSKITTREIKIFSSLHDVGKIAIPREILNKPGKLTTEEFEIMKTHTTRGAEIIDNLKNISKNKNLASNIALYHHEKWNGNGYPEGLVGEAIPIEARIVALSDVYDALRMPRVYKEGFSHTRTCQMILSESGKHFDPKLVEIFIKKNKEFKNIYDSSI